MSLHDSTHIIHMSLHDSTHIIVRPRRHKGGIHMHDSVYEDTKFGSRSSSSAPCTLAQLTLGLISSAGVSKTAE